MDQSIVPAASEQLAEMLVPAEPDELAEQLEMLLSGQLPVMDAEEGHGCWLLKTQTS